MKKSFTVFLVSQINVSWKKKLFSHNKNVKNITFIFNFSYIHLFSNGIASKFHRQSQIRNCFEVNWNAMKKLNNKKKRDCIQ